MEIDSRIWFGIWSECGIGRRERSHGVLHLQGKPLLRPNSARCADQLESERVPGLSGRRQDSQRSSGWKRKSTPATISTISSDFQVELDQNTVDGARALLTYEYARKSETVMAAACLSSCLFVLG